ncbi:DUF6221 family protein [Streptomyces sp. NEAU-174]|uniref:DUF6221 family protein n=1 Tax=Streptomyces sp. NEAU-174 TaxID=3458254 RepID=UPI0040442F95
MAAADAVRLAATRSTRSASWPPVHPPRPARQRLEPRVAPAGARGAGPCAGNRVARLPERHAVEHDPARVLREIDAKRKILRDLEQAGFTLSKAGLGTPPHDLMTGAVNSLRRTVRLHAEVYDQRPGFRNEWRPQPHSMKPHLDASEVGLLRARALRGRRFEPATTGGPAALSWLSYPAQARAPPVWP